MWKDREQREVRMTIAQRGDNYLEHNTPDIATYSSLRRAPPHSQYAQMNTSMSFTLLAKDCCIRRYFLALTRIYPDKHSTVARIQQESVVLHSILYTATLPLPHEIPRIPSLQRFDRKRNTRLPNWIRLVLFFVFLYETHTPRSALFAYLVKSASGGLATGVAVLGDGGVPEVCGDGATDEIV
jgi:hypothetical protein